MDHQSYSLLACCRNCQHFHTPRRTYDVALCKRESAVSDIPPTVSPFAVCDEFSSLGVVL